MVDHENLIDQENLIKVRTAYDSVAEAYARVIPDTTFESLLDMAMVDEFAGRIRTSADRLVIDAGCGAGRMSKYLTRKGLNVTGVDLSPEMSRVAQQLHPGLRFEVGELTDLPASDSAADGILAWYSIIHPPPGRRCRQLRGSSGESSAHPARRSSLSRPAEATA